MILEDTDNAPIPPTWVLVPVAEAVTSVPLTGKKLQQSAYLKQGLLPVVDQGQELIGGHTDAEDMAVNTEGCAVVFGDHTKCVKFLDRPFVAGADGIKVLIPNPCYIPKALYYFLKAVRLPDKGYARHFQFLWKATIPLPPLPEQHRIVAKVDELFSDLDAGVDALKKTKALLKRYRQSVLKAAFTGKLTVKWREFNKGKLEPASVLLERIQEERMRAGGKKAKELPPVDTSDLPELPEGWAWTRLGYLSANESNAVTDGPFGSNLKTSHYTDSGPRVIRLQNIGDGVFVDEKAHISEDHYQRLQKYRVLPGDLVIASLDEAPPRSCIVPSDVVPAIVKADCIRFKVNNEMVLAKYVNFLLNTTVTRKRSEPYLHGVGRPRLGMTGIRMIPVPLAPVPEQSAVLAEIERRFTIVDQVEKTIEQSLKQSQRLRQSILKRAFSGRLVPQDPKDEPAEKLLERIKAERERHRHAGRKGKRADD